MTIPSTVIRNTYANSSGGSVFPYTFKIFDDTDIKVILTDPDGVESIAVLTTDYTVSGVDSEDGGNVTFNTAVTAGTSVSIVAVIDRTDSGTGIQLTQDTDLVNETGFFQDRIEDRFDILTRQTQIVADETARSLRITSAVDPNDYDLEIPAPEANTVLGSTDGTSYENIPLVSSEDAVAGRWTVETFVNGVGFTAGTSNSITLTEVPPSLAAILVAFDGITQFVDTMSLAGATITFDTVIPFAVQTIEVRIPKTLALGVLPDQGVATANLEDGAVTAAKLASDAVTTVKILDANVTAAKLATDAVTTAKIADANVTTGKLATGSVTLSKLATGLAPGNWTDGGAIEITAITTNPTKGGLTYDKAWYRRVGDSMEVRFEFFRSAGTAGSGDYLFTIPGGQSIDGTKISAYWAGPALTAGHGNGIGSATVGNVVNGSVGYVVPYSATKVRIVFLVPASGTVAAMGSSNYHLGATCAFNATFTVPISGWALS